VGKGKAQREHESGVGGPREKLRRHATTNMSKAIRERGGHRAEPPKKGADGSEGPRRHGPCSRKERKPEKRKQKQREEQKRGENEPARQCHGERR